MSGRIWKVPTGQNAPMIQQGVIFTPQDIAYLEKSIDFSKVEFNESKTYSSYVIDGIIQLGISKKNSLEQSTFKTRVYLMMNLISMDLLRHLLKQPINKPYAKAWLPLIETGKMKSINLSILVEPSVKFRQVLQTGERYYLNNVQNEQVKNQFKNYGFAFTFKNGQTGTKINTLWNDGDVDILNSFFSKITSVLEMETIKHVSKYDITSNDHQSFFLIEQYTDREGVERNSSRLRIKFQPTGDKISRDEIIASESCLGKPSENEQNQYTKLYFQIYHPEKDYTDTVYQTLVNYSQKSHRYQYQFINEVQLLQVLGDKSYESVKFLLRPQLVMWLEQYQQTGGKTGNKKSDRIFSTAIHNTVVAIQEFVEKKDELPEPEFSAEEESKQDSEIAFDQLNDQSI